jgi:hypothetical protein
MKAMQSLIGATLVVGTALALQPNADAQRWHRGEDRKYIGSYFRTLPNGRGTELLAVSPGGTLQLTRTGPRGKSHTFSGAWFVRHGNIHVSVSGLPGNPPADYRLVGSNLNLVGDKHIFFKKQ